VRTEHKTTRLLTPKNFLFPLPTSPAASRETVQANIEVSELSYQHTVFTSGMREEFNKF
jgi:hypothetical protein